MNMMNGETCWLLIVLMVEAQIVTRWSDEEEPGCWCPSSKKGGWYRPPEAVDIRGYWRPAGGQPMGRGQSDFENPHNYCVDLSQLWDVREELLNEH